MKIYNHFFHKYHKPVIISDYESGKIIEVNEQVLTLLEKSNEDFQNLKRTDIFTKKAISELKLSADKKVASTGTFILNKEGHKINVEITSELIEEDNKNFLADTISVSEVKKIFPAEDHEIQRLIKDSEIKYRTLFESANDAIFLLKENFITDLNSKALELFRGTKEQLLGKTPYDLSPEFQPDGTKSYYKAIKKIQNILEGHPQLFEWQHKKLDDSLFDAEVSLNTFNINNENYILAIVRDITQRKKTESDLKESQRSLFNLLKNLPGIAYRCKNDKSWTMEFISEQCYSLTGYYYDQLMNNRDLSYGELIVKEDREMVWQEIQSALKNKKSFTINYRIKTADSNIKWVWEQGNGIYSDETGELIYIEGLINDITEQKLTEEALKNSEAQFRSLVEESLAGVYIIQDGKFPYVNPRLAEIFGYKPEEIINIKNVDDLVVEEDRQKAEENINKRLSGEVKTVNYTFRGLRKDKSVVDIEVIGTLTVFNGRPAVIGTLLDITERNKTDKKIKNLSRAVEQSPASIIITETEGNIEYVNSKFTEITGYTLDDVIGKNPRIFRYGDTPKSFYENLWKTIKSGEEWHGEFLNKKKNGELFWEFASISPVKDNEGKIINFLAVKEDITERKNIEEELKIAKDKAEEMNQLKSVFLANMSHELRTPMVAVLGYSEILKNEIVNPGLRDMANEVYESSKRFMNTLNLILDLSRVESKKEIINLVELEVVSVVKDEFDFFKNLAGKKELKLIYDLPEEPLYSLVDERMLRQIVSSITSNAIKFTNKGSVSLIVAKAEEKPGREQVVIKIVDTGIGIPKQNQNVIFDAFRQVSEGLNRTFEGTGLGLTVSKKFAEMMNGNIEFESEFGKGTTLIIKIPVIRKPDIYNRIPDSSQIKPEISGNLRNNLTQLLLVEDDPSNAGVIKFFLKNKYVVDMASTGEEAITKAEEKKYAAVLMDIDLGAGINGLEAAKRIREISGYQDTPIIAVTALAMKGDKEKFLDEGCTHYISKPFKKEYLLKTIKEAIGYNRNKI